MVEELRVLTMGYATARTRSALIAAITSSLSGSTFTEPRFSYVCASMIETVAATLFPTRSTSRISFGDRGTPPAPPFD
jgi:hypothetical protein